MYDCASGQNLSLAGDQITRIVIWRLTPKPSGLFLFLSRCLFPVWKNIDNFLRIFDAHLLNYYVDNLNCT